MKKSLAKSIVFFIVLYAFMMSSLSQGFAALNFTEVEPNNSIGTADVITPDYSDQTNVYGQINYNHHDLDFYRFNFTAKTRMKIMGYWSGHHFGKGWEDDLLIGIINSSGTLTHVAEYRKIGSSYYSYLDVTLNAGTYYMIVMQNDEYPQLYINQTYTVVMKFNYTQTTVAPTGVSVDKSSMTLLGLGSTEKITATVAPTNASNKNVTWKSSDTSVATVSSSGVVTAIGPGNATITATTASGGFSATTAVHVVVPVASLTSDRSSIELNGKNHSIKISATILPQNATNQVLTWESDNTSAAIVSDDGTITSVNGGTGHIIARTTDGSDIVLRIPFSVVIPLSKIEYHESKQRISIIGLNTEHTLTYALEPNDATNKTVKWISSDPSVVTVSDTGQLISKNYGEAVITIMSTDGTNLQDTIIVKVDQAIPWTLIILGVIGLILASVVTLMVKASKKSKQTPILSTTLEDNSAS